MINLQFEKINWNLVLILYVMNMFLKKQSGNTSSPHLGTGRSTLRTREPNFQVMPANGTYFI